MALLNKLTRTQHAIGRLGGWHHLNKSFLVNQFQTFGQRTPGGHNTYTGSDRKRLSFRQLDKLKIFRGPENILSRKSWSGAGATEVRHLRLPL